MGGNKRQKRGRSSSSDDGSDFKPDPSSRASSCRPDPASESEAKPDVKPKLSKPKSKPSPSAGKLPPGSKSALASLIVQRGLANLPPHAECAAATGMTPAQVRNQLDPRKGVRKELLRLAENMG